MKIINLIENTVGSKGCLIEHGLSFYIESGGHKLLVDTGASNAFMQNAGKLGVDLKQVDMLVLSHGHYDHGGGILDFARLNPDAKILMRRSAGGENYHKNEMLEKYIGIDPQIMGLLHVELVDGDKEAGDGIFLFGSVSGRKLWPSGNRELKVKRDGQFYQDEFEHEQYLVLTENGKRVLVSGCAHNGILNILERYQEIYGEDPAAVVSGFHMKKKPGSYTDEDLEVVRKIAGELIKTDTVYYTGHCTGETPYQIMKEIMGGQLVYVHSGDMVTL